MSYKMTEMAWRKSKTLRSRLDDLSLVVVVEGKLELGEGVEELAGDFVEENGAVAVELVCWVWRLWDHRTRWLELGDGESDRLSPPLLCLALLQNIILGR